MGINLPTPTESEVSIAIIRCGCGDPDSHVPNPCPSPRSVTDIGRVGFSSTDLDKQAAWDQVGESQATARIRHEAEANHKES